MKSTTPALISYLNAIRPIGDGPLYMADLFTIRLSNGSVLTYTSTDTPVFWNGHTYSASSLLISGLKYRASIGLSVDTQQITIAARSTDTIDGVPALQALQQGLLDSASITRERVFMVAWNAAPIGSVMMFKGRVASVDSVGRTTAQITVSSDLILLDIDMPRNVYQPTCNHTLYDSGCGLAKSEHSTTGSASAGSTKSHIIWEESSVTYQQGTVLFTSGLNSGLTRTVLEANSSGLKLAYPLPNTPAVGDTFVASQGCDHCMATCSGKFDNLPRFRGFPFVPSRNVVTGFS